VTDDSAFKKQVRARMAETGEKYTVARRMVAAGRDPGQPPVVLRVYLRSHVDLELTAEAGRAYAAADDQVRQEMADRLLADHIEVAGAGEAQVAAASRIMTDQEPRTEAEAVAGPKTMTNQQLRAEAEAATGPKTMTNQQLRAEAEGAEAEAAEDAAVRGVVQRGIERAVGVSAVEVGRAGDQLRVGIRAVRPILLTGRRGEEADRLRGELEELTGRRVRLDIWQVPEGTQNEGPARAG
jgi:hypothetical protein